MTELLYQGDAYLTSADAKVTDVIVDEDGRFGLVFDRTVFYPESGGVACDTGRVKTDVSEWIDVTEVTKSQGEVIHWTDRRIEPGTKVRMEIDWDRRYTLMRYHTAAHVIAGLFYTRTGALITGNRITVEKARFDFSLKEFDRSLIESIIDEANSYFGKDIPVTVRYLPRDEALKIPSMVKLANAFPPSIKVLRIVRIGTKDHVIDEQADGGPHVSNLREVPKVRILKMENKGKGNRRVYFSF
ncbi:alanyl-tRNA editing protein [Candidatus Micrarchaeota archaeon]|nr:alanyl-tRNA editing protein [Candidatus Micrarchaeota archaeon]